MNTVVRLVIKLIQVDLVYKALVIDEMRETDRLVYLSESIDKDEAFDDAMDFVEMASRHGSILWH